MKYRARSADDARFEGLDEAAARFGAQKASETDLFLFSTLIFNAKSAWKVT
ncbi:MAG: hypothetical protein ACXW27_02230 [Allosphingosinicella sp.]